MIEHIEPGIISMIEHIESALQVQELVSGRLWRYPECVLMRIPSCQVPEPFPYPTQPGEGSYVTLAHTYNNFSDAARGPLSLLMRDDDVYGIVLMESGRRFRVRPLLVQHQPAGSWCPTRL
jgi:hypothetical protein